MANPRFEFSLEQLRAEHWRLFERLCSEFLADEFPALRTTANANGDRGRDGEIFRIDGITKTVFQYSVTAGWNSKISDTIKTIKKNFPTANRIIYCTNQSIGAKSDPIRSSAWEEGILLDVRDKDWFVERSSSNTARATASEELAIAITDPLLQQRKLVEIVATPLSQEESRIALLQLALNQRDRETERGLTKTSFEALVSAALINTNAETARTLEDIQETVLSYLPSAKPYQVNALVQSALTRLSQKRGPIKFRSDTKKYHLSFESETAWKNETAEYIQDQEELESDLMAGAYGLNEALDADPKELRKEARVLRAALEEMLWRRGEAFAETVKGDSETAGVDMSAAEMAEIISAMELPLRLQPSQAAVAIQRILISPSDRTQQHLTRALDAYTLFAFLQQTPDVQKTLSRIFSGGEIWMDTSAILPLLGEILVEDESRRIFTALLEAARDSGLHLYVTDGVIEEVETHISNSERYIRMSAEWEGRVPFLYSMYMLSGRAESEFAEWAKLIRGTFNPRMDVEDYLRHHFGIKKKNLLELSDAADIDLRGAVQELWRESHEKRRFKRRYNSSTSRLIQHDVENVVGIIQRRKRSSGSPLGFTSWWLTLDSTAFRLNAWMKDRLGKSAPHSPVLSPDYLSQILRLGPLRRELGSSEVSKLPLAATIRALESLPKELMEIAKNTRQQFANYDELRIRREVRDALDRSRIPVASERDYASTLDAEIVEAIEAGNET